VTDTANQTQDIAGLSRNTSNFNGPVSKLPDMNNLLDRQADTIAAARVAGEAVSRRIGDFAQSEYDEAKANDDQAGMDPASKSSRQRLRTYSTCFVVTKKFV
jgi:filamentous hemagglutinin